MKIAVTGLNHRSAPLELRERLAVRAAELPRALEGLRRRQGAPEALILSTCNRVEIYTAGLPGEAARQAAAGFCASWSGLPEERFLFSLYFHEDEQAVAHLLRVAAGLDSLVLGETQILGQLKQAYRAAHAAGATGGRLNPLFQRAFAAAKEIHAGSALSRGQLSLAGVAAGIAGEIFRDFARKTALLVGAGANAELTLRHLARRGLGQVLVANRTPARAEALARRYGGRAIPLEELGRHLPAADIVLASAEAPAALIGREEVRQARRARRGAPLYLVDLAVPRNIEPAAGELENVFLYNVDDLQERAERNLDGRRGEVEACQRLARERAAALVRELRAAEVAELLAALTRTGRERRAAECARLLRRLGVAGEAARAEAERALQRLVNRLLHAPLRAVREDARLGGARGLAEALRALFGLP